MDLIPDEQFTQLSVGVTGSVPNHHNYCEVCRIPMTRERNIWTCATCGLMSVVEGEVKDHGEDSKLSMRITNSGRYYKVTADYNKAQFREISEHLAKNNDKCPDNLKIPLSIIEKVAANYNDIQKLENISNSVNGQTRKFVKRGNNKDEILAALVFDECNKANMVRKKSDIAEWMQLKKKGFSRGETILKSLKSTSKIKLQLDAESMDSFINRYLNAVGVMDIQHRKFVSDLVQKSFECFIGNNSIVPTKVVGAIWILITREDTYKSITVDHIESKCDNIKKNTFIKFVKAIEENIDLVVDVFRQYNIHLAAR